jgi:hypothetical protein
MDERIEYIKELQEKSYKLEPRQSGVLGNFYAIVTIVAVCLSVLYYVNYILPVQKEKMLREHKVTKHQKYLDERAKRIALSHKLNSRDYNATK